MSDDEQYDLFCTHCGQRITEGTTFCPSCGTQITDMGGEPTFSGNGGYWAPPQMDMNSRLKFLAILFVVTAVYFLISGIFDLMYIDESVDSSIDLIKMFGMWDEYLDSFRNLGMDEQEAVELMRILVIVSSICEIITGVTVSVSAYCSFTKKYWKVGLVFCILATIAASVSMIGLVIGAIVTYLYTTTRPCFQS